MMETNKTQIAAPDLCHNCKHGGEIVEKCGCQKLGAWYNFAPRTWTNADWIGKVKGMAAEKGRADFNPVPSMAVVAAVMEEQCRYYEPIQPDLFAE